MLALIVQVALTAYAEAVQPLFILTTPAFVPPRTTEEMCSGAEPELVSATLCGPAEVPCVTVPNATALGLRVTTGLPGGGAWPVPVSGTDCGELGASSAMVTLAVRCPAPSGANVTLMVQEEFGARGALHVLPAKLKSPGLEPLRRTEEMCSVALPALVTVMVCAGLVLPCAVVGNVKLPGISVTAGRGDTPVPVNGTVCGLPGALSAIASEACRSPAAVGEKTMLIVQVPFGA